MNLIMAPVVIELVFCLRSCLMTSCCEMGRMKLTLHMEERGISCLGGAPTFAEIDLCGVGAGVLKTKLPFSEDIV